MLLSWLSAMRTAAIGLQGGRHRFHASPLGDQFQVPRSAVRAGEFGDEGRLPETNDPGAIVAGEGDSTLGTTYLCARAVRGLRRTDFPRYAKCVRSDSRTDMRVAPRTPALATTTTSSASGKGAWRNASRTRRLIRLRSTARGSALREIASPRRLPVPGAAWRGAALIAKKRSAQRSPSRNTLEKSAARSSRRPFEKR